MLTPTLCDLLTFAVSLCVAVMLTPAPYALALCYSSSRSRELIASLCLSPRGIIARELHAKALEGRCD